MASVSSLASNNNNSNGRKIKLISSYLAALLIVSVCGTQYLFSTYSVALADRLGYNSVQINTIGGFADCGYFLNAPINGFIIDKYGSKKTTLVASFIIFLGYFCLAMTYSGHFHFQSFILCAFYLFFAGAASSAGFLSSLGIVAKNFPSYRGITFGLLVALFGLSAFIFAQINNFFFKDDTYKFLLFISITTGSSLFVGSWFLNVTPQPSPLNNNHGGESLTIESEERQGNNETSPSLRSIPPLSDISITGWKFLKNDSALLLGFSIFFIGGIGLLYINNVGTIIKTLYYQQQQVHFTAPSSGTQHLQNYHVSLLSALSCFGRISAGVFSDVGKRLFNLRRLWFLILAGFWLFIGNLMTAVYVKDINDLWIVTAFIGYGYGNLYGVAPAIASEWFGVKNFGFNWGIMLVFPAIGGQLFNLFFGVNYDLHKHDCQGYNCYNTIFYFSALGTLTSICLLSVLLYRRIKKRL